MPHLQAFKLLVRHTQGPEDRVDLAMIHVGANCLANGALRQEKGWRSSENSDVEEPRLTSVQYSSPSQDFAAPPSPVQGRLVETHTHTHTHARRRRLHTPPHHQAAIAAVFISGVRPSFRPSSRAKRGKCAEQALARGLGTDVGL